MPKLEDRHGDEDEDEVLEQPPPPNPLFYPSPSVCKRPQGKTERSAARQPLPPSLPKSLNRAVGQTNQLSTPQQGSLHLAVGHAPAFLVPNWEK